MVTSSRAGAVDLAESLGRRRGGVPPEGRVDEHICPVNVRKVGAVEDELFERHRGIRVSGVVDGIGGGHHHPEKHRLAGLGIDARESFGDQRQCRGIGQARG